MEIFVARQPIFDVRDQLFAYELLYRSGRDSGWADGVSVAQMSRDVVVQSFLDIGMERMTEGALGFVNFSREMLLERAWELLPADKIVVELLETVEADAAVVEACAALRDAGYRLALDDWTPGGSQDVLLPRAEIIKVDVLGLEPEQIGAAIEPLGGGGHTLLAERVETAEIRDRCRELGFTLFQGYFFSRPELVSKRTASPQQTAVIELMNLLYDESATDQQIENAFRRDPGLSFKLLRMVNTAASGVRGIESIQHGVRLLGRGVLRRWLALLLASSLGARGGTDQELIYTAVLRGRFLERLAAETGRADAAGPLFLVGLFSLMDALMQMPMDEVLSRVNLSDEARRALTGSGGPYAGWLTLLDAYEQGDWDRVEQVSQELQVPPQAVSDLYLDSLQWTREKVSAAQG